MVGREETMSSTFEDVKSACFDGRTVLHAFYAEPFDARLLATVLRPLGTELSDGKSALRQAKTMLAMGFRPVIQSSYNFRFVCDVPAELLMSHLNASMTDVGSRHLTRCWFMDDCTLLAALVQFRKRLARNFALRRGENGANYTFAAKKGERLASLTTIHVPLPNVLVA